VNRFIFSILSFFVFCWNQIKIYFYWKFNKIKNSIYGAFVNYRTDYVNRFIFNFLSFFVNSVGNKIKIYFYWNSMGSKTAYMAFRQLLPSQITWIVLFSIFSFFVNSAEIKSNLFYWKFNRIENGIYGVFVTTINRLRESFYFQIFSFFVNSAKIKPKFIFIENSTRSKTAYMAYSSTTITYYINRLFSNFLFLCEFCWNQIKILFLLKIQRDRKQHIWRICRLPSQITWIVLFSILSFFVNSVEIKSKFIFIENSTGSKTVYIAYSSTTITDYVNRFIFNFIFLCKLLK